MMNYTEIGRKTITVNGTISRLNAPINTQLAFVEVEGDIRYSTSNTEEPLTASSGGALLTEGTKIDIKGISVYHFRMISADGTDKTIHITFLGA